MISAFIVLCTVQLLMLSKSKYIQTIENKTNILNSYVYFKSTNTVLIDTLFELETYIGQHNTPVFSSLLEHFTDMEHIVHSIQTKETKKQYLLSIHQEIKNTLDSLEHDLPVLSELEKKKYDKRIALLHRMCDSMLLLIVNQANEELSKENITYLLSQPKPHNLPL